MSWLFNSESFDPSWLTTSPTLQTTWNTNSLNNLQRSENLFANPDYLISYATQQVISERVFTSFPTITTQPTTNANLDEYDYIIIGAGTTGCYLANKIANRDTSKSVCLMNSGDEFHSIKIGGKVQKYQLFDVINTGAYSTNPKNVLYNEITNNEYYTLSGLGGLSQQTNKSFNLAIKGASYSFHNWGLTNITFDSLFNNFPEEADWNINVDHSNNSNPLQTKFINALLAISSGASLLTGDINNAQNDERGIFTSLPLFDVSKTSKSLYLNTIPSNLTILKNCFCLRMLFNDSKNQVVGTEYIDEKLQKPVKIALKTGTHSKVILSSGIQNTQILERSGIGKQTFLVNELKMNPQNFILQNTNLGNSLSFQMEFHLLCKSNTFHLVSNLDNQNKTIAAAFHDYNNSGHRDWFIQIQAGIDEAPLYIKQKARLEMKTNYEKLILIKGRLLVPLTKAKVHLESLSNLTNPDIVMNDMESEDINSIVALQWYLYDIFQNLKISHSGENFQLIWPAQSIYDNNITSDVFAEALLGMQIVPQWCGQCALGTVVDENSFSLKNSTLTKLKIVDASIIPKPPSGTLTLSSLAIARYFMENIF